MQLSPSQAHPGSGKAATSCGSFCGSKQLAQGQSQAASDADLNQSLFQEAPEPKHPGANHRQHESDIRSASQAAHPKGHLSRHQTPRRIMPLVSVPAQQLVHCGLGRSSPSASLRAEHTQKWANRNKDSIITGGLTQHLRGTFLESLAQVGNVEDLSNT